jgi:ABC-type phosphate/phosphonate transport system ATPase subunit
MTGPVLDVRHARVTYQGNVTALDDVSLTMAGGEFVAIVGPSAL